MIEFLKTQDGWKVAYFLREAEVWDDFKKAGESNIDGSSNK